jgi:glucan phosphoethanolaminetransferase (alkaline phosphatase superfamily)
MNENHFKSRHGDIPLHPLRSLYGFLAPRAHSVIMFAALFCTLAVKFFHAWRVEQLDEYPGWIAADVAVLLGIEVLLAIACFRWPRRWVLRTAIIIAAVVCTWSVMNAGWLIRTGTQILPTVLLPLFRDPINALAILGVNLSKMPLAAVLLLGPSAVALTFFFFVLARPHQPHYDHKRFTARIFVCVSVILLAAFAPIIMAKRSSAPVGSEGLYYNCHVTAFTSLLSPRSADLTNHNSAGSGRKIPAYDNVQITPPKLRTQSPNVVIVVLEGIQYSYTSLADKQANLTPYLASLAAEGVEFQNARCTVTHTTKVLFSLLTGRFPSVSQDIAETVPVDKPYAGIAAALQHNMNFRTAFFQSAKGNFEARPGLVHNLGFDKFWARDDLDDPNMFLGYLACDEFSMLEPVVQWLHSDDRPFLLTILCSVTHDPYEVPRWFAEPAKDPVERYRQAIYYTDKFIAALDVEIAKLNLADKTIFCVVGDHGEAFGEHGLLGHERIAFEEALRIPWVMRAPFLIQPDSKISKPVSSVDLTPTLLALLGFDVNSDGFDGIDALGQIPDDRQVFFSGWLAQSPAGFVKASQKYTYYPATQIVGVCNLAADPLESTRVELPENWAGGLAEQIINWRDSSIFQLPQPHTGERTLYQSWLCHWNNRVCSAKFRPPTEN